MRRGGFLPNGGMLGGALGLSLLVLWGLAPSAHAQVVLTERVRIQGGYTTQLNPAPQARLSVGFAGVQPGITLFWFQPSATYSVDQSVNGILYTDGTAEFDEYLTLASAFQLSPQTQLLMSASGTYTSLTQLLIANPAPNTPVTLLPAAGAKLVSIRLNESLRHDLTDKVRLTQTSDAALYSTLAPAIPNDTFSANLGGGVQRLFGKDSLGVDAKAGYGEVLTIPPGQDVHYGTVNAGPTWRHDWTPTISSSINAGGSMAFSFDGGGSPVFGPSATATLAYVVQPTVVTLTYVSGYYPSFLTGQLSQVNAGTLHALYPLSVTRQIFVGATVGGGHTNVVTLQGPANDVSFNSFFGDTDITWQATPLIQPYARYQFIGQIGNSAAAAQNLSYLRDTFLVGIQITSMPPGANRGTPGGYTVPTTFPQRVDDKDTPAPPNPNDVPPPQPLPSTTGISDGVQHPEDRGLPPPQDPNMPDNGANRWIYTTKPVQPAQPTPSQPKPPSGTTP